MRRALAVLCTIATAAVLPTVAETATATTPASPASDAAAPHRSHVRADPLATQRSVERQQAVDALASGDARLAGRGADRVIVMADGTEEPYPVDETAQLLTFLVEFGDDPTGIANPAFPTSGPQHDEIPEPPASDNSTYWLPSFDREHYQEMFFDGLSGQDGESMRDIYQQMSNGKFDLEGDVSEWVQVDHPESYYNDELGYENQLEMTAFIQDSADAWYDAQLAAGKSPSEIAAYLQTFDQWDRFDADGDGVSDEPDGYIDHFQAVHAGEGEEAQAPGEDIWQIWSHRWAANIAGFGEDGPTCSGCVELGGVQIGDTGLWIRDYTTEPENGGLGVFAHEFGHDLGLPDYYDTASDIDNGTGFWNLMSSGSWLGHGAGDTGTTPNHMGATEKLFLGWYGSVGGGPTDNVAVVDGTSPTPAEVTLGPSYHRTTTGKQAVLVTLPDGEATIDGPSAGSDDGDYLYSGTSSDRYATATSGTIELSPVEPSVSASVAYDIEEGWDYAYLQVSDDGGTTWTNVDTSLSTDDDPQGQNLGHGITGDSGGHGDTWVSLAADLTAWAGEDVQLRWTYRSDGATNLRGLSVDEMTMNGGGYSTSYSDVSDWTLDDFYSVVDGAYDVQYERYYIAENRQYRGYDRTLETGPYSSNNPVSAPNRVDHFPYQDGLLVWYANTFYGDNDTSLHPGSGANLPVDANPKNQVWAAGGGGTFLASNRLQTYDSTFDVDTTDGVHMTSEAAGGLRLDVPEHPSVPVFDDTDTDAYLDDSGGTDGLNFSTEVAGAGAMIQVLSSDESTGEMVVKVGKRFVAATGTPVIAGTPAAGRTIGVRLPTWFQRSVRTSVQWLSDGVPVGSGSSYKVGAGDVDAEITAVVTGSKPGHLSTSVESAGVTGLRESLPATTKVAIAGTARVGSTLEATPATWPVVGDSSYSWWVGGEQVGTGASYVVTPADLGKAVVLEETFSSDGYADASSVDTSEEVVVGPAATPTAPLAITGTPSVGSTLTAQPAAWSRAGASTLAWTVGGVAAGTGTTYVVTPADLGRTITLTETRSTTGYAGATTSATTAAVTPGAAPAPTKAPAIAGTARVGSTLSVTGATWPRAGSSTFAWTVGGASVGTGATYVVKAGDSGKKVTVTETFTSPGYGAGTASATSRTVAKAPVTLGVAVGPAKRSKKVSLSVRAGSPDLTVTGKVRVTYDGDVVDTLALKGGKVRLALPKRGKGTYELEVTYLPAPGFKPASRKVDVKVR